MGGKHKLPRYLLAALICAAPCKLCLAQIAPPPQVAAVQPTEALTTPGAKVMILGANFSPDFKVYFGGLQARAITFVNSSALRAVTPYLRPGTYKLDLKSADAVTHTGITFRALPAPVDSTLDQAEGLAAKNQADAAIAILMSIATSNPDYDVRAYAHYRAGLLYLARGNYWEAGVQAGLIWDRKVSMGVQSSWRYRLLSDEITYSVSRSNNQDTDLVTADWDVKWDVTDNPEPRFWRALMNARFGKMQEAKEDLKYILAAQPENPSYRALAAYIAVLSGDEKQLEAFRGQQVSDSRALRLLGQAAYLSGNYDAAQAWWTAQAKSNLVWSRLDYMAGRKHLEYGQTRVGTALIAECATIAPDSREGKEAAKLLADMGTPPH